MPANIIVRNLAQREAQRNTITYKISLILHDKIAIYSHFLTFLHFRRTVQIIVILTLEHKPQIMATSHEKARVGNYAGLCVLPHGDGFAC